MLNLNTSLSRIMLRGRGQQAVHERSTVHTDTALRVPVSYQGMFVDAMQGPSEHAIWPHSVTARLAPMLLLCTPAALHSSRSRYSYGTSKIPGTRWRQWVRDAGAKRAPDFTALSTIQRLALLLPALLVLLHAAAAACR